MNPFILRQFKRGKRLVGRIYSAYQRLAKDANIKRRIFRVPGFSQLLEKISKGEAVCSDDVLPYISQELRENRLWLNFKLAEAFYNAGKYRQAKPFIQRVWELSGFDEQYLSLFIKIHVAVDDIDSVRKAHKILGIKKTDENKIAQALKHFNDWQYAYAIHRGLDDYQYDYEVLNQIKQLANLHSCPLKQLQPLKNRKIRLAYLMFGLLQSNSVIVKISLLFAKYHDSSQFEITFCVPEQISTILECQEAVDNIKIIKELGWNVVMAPDTISEEKGLIYLSRLIYDSNPDILITNAALADLKHYFFASLRPAPLVIGLCQGPAPQFIAPDFNWSIVWFNSLVIDCPTDCSWINLRLDLPDRIYSREESKSCFGVPKDALVIMSAGRPTKFMDIGFWKTIIDLLHAHPFTYYVAVGIAGKPPLFLTDLLTPDIIKRVKILGWEKDFHKVLSMADIVVDTYPSGGGVVIKDAMALSTPVVSFKHDYMKVFSQTECSAADEVISIPELLIERGDFHALNKLLSRLLTDQSHREHLSVLCKERIIETSGNPRKMVENCEKVYLNVLEKFS